MLGVSTAFILTRELWQAIRWADEVFHTHPTMQPSNAVPHTTPACKDALEKSAVATPGNLLGPQKLWIFYGMAVGLWLM